MTAREEEQHSGGVQELSGQSSPSVQERLKTLIEVANELEMARDADAMIRRAVELARTRLRLDRIGIWFLTDEPYTLRGSFGVDEEGCIRDERQQRFTVHPGEFLYKVIEERSPRATRMEGALHDDRQHKVGEGNWACATMWDGRDAIGFVVMDNYLSGSAITDDDLELLTLFASALGHHCTRRRIEDALRHSEQAHRDTLNAMADSIHVVDKSLRIVLVNSAFMRWRRELGFEDPIIGKTVEEAFPFLPSDVQEEYRTVLSTGQLLATEEKIEVNGQQITTSTRKIPVLDDGELQHIVTVVRDISKQEEAEKALEESREQLLQAQKMEALGRLAGGIAHDFNNLLTTILGYGHLMVDRLSKEDPLREEAQEIVRAGERAVELTSQLLSFGRRKPGHVRPVNINTVVMETDSLLRRTLGEDVELVTIPGERLEGVKLESGKLQQVLMNLAINARDAMQDGGKLTIKTEKVTLAETDSSQHVEARPGEFVCLTVSDTGSGMPAEVRDHIFEPFYTTKDRGKGSGLGLSTVYGIVKQTEGWIDLESAPGQGTTFRLYFPAHEEMMPEILPSETPPDLPHGQETILVVEDEETVRHFTAKVLESLGYNVLQASNGGEALLVFETHSGTIDVVLTDIVMPLMNGRELVRRLRETGREFNVMYMTGFSEDALEEEGRAVLLQKPYTREGLARMLRQVLDQGAGAGSRQS